MYNLSNGEENEKREPAQPRPPASEAGREAVTNEKAGEATGLPAVIKKS